MPGMRTGMFDSRLCAGANLAALGHDAIHHVDSGADTALGLSGAWGQDHNAASTGFNGKEGAGGCGVEGAECASCVESGQNRGEDVRMPVMPVRGSICPGGVGFETSSASGGWGAVLVSNLTQPGIYGVSVRVLGMGLGLGCSQVPCPTRERERGKIPAVCKRDLPWLGSEVGKANLILQSDTVCHFSSRFVLIQADGEFTKAL